MRNSVVAVFAVLLMSSSAKASVEEFNFSFDNFDGHFSGLVKVDTAASKATALYFTNLPSSYNYNYGSSYDFLAHSNNVVYNTFHVANGKVVFVDYGTGINFGTSNDYQLGLYQDRSEFIHGDRYFTGARATFTLVSAVPLPASAPMFGAALMALGAVGYGMKRKKAAA